MSHNSPRLSGDLADPVAWTIADLREFNEGRAAFLTSIAEHCGVPRMNAFVHALEMGDRLDADHAIHAVTASRVYREMTEWAAERAHRTHSRALAQRRCPLLVKHHDLRCGRGAARAARTWLAEVMNDQAHKSEQWRVDLAGDAKLCLNELVIAALSAGSTALALSVAMSTDVLRISVLGDAARRTDPMDLNVPTLRAQVMSFRIVDGFADDWGANGVIAGRELWAEFALHGSSEGDADHHIARRALNLCT